MATLGGCVSEPFGPPATSRQAIVGGSQDSDDPAVVLVYIAEAYACTGTVISPRVILTAAHCLRGYTASQVSVFYGMSVYDGGSWVPVVDAWSNPGWDPNDLAAGKDVGAVTVADPAPAVPVPLFAGPITSSLVGSPLRIVGYGTTNTAAGDAGVRYQGTTAIAEFDAQLLFLGASGATTCHGDSGGPAFLSVGGVEHIAGLTAFGADACNSEAADTRVDVVLPLIQQYLDAHDPPSCGADSRCATDCTEVDPDCPCAADGFCTGQCADVASDPDCEGCGAGDACREDCPSPDADCTSSPGDPAGPSTEPQAQAFSGGYNVQGGCGVATGRAGAGSVLWLIVVAGARRRRPKR